MSKKDEALKLALEALDRSMYTTLHNSLSVDCANAITAIREALAEQPAQQQEPNENAALLAANRDLQVHFDVLMADYKKLSELCTNQGIRLMEVEDDFAGHEHPVQQQEPFCYHDGRNIVGKEFAGDSDVFPLYTSPPASKPWRGLTLEDKQRVLDGNFGGSRADCMDEAEKILRERNA